MVSVPMAEIRVPLKSGLSRAAALFWWRYFADIVRSVGAEGCSVDLIAPKPGRRHGWCVELCRPADDPLCPIREGCGVLSDLLRNYPQ